MKPYSPNTTLIQQKQQGDNILEMRAMNNEYTLRSAVTAKTTSRLMTFAAKLHARCMVLRNAMLAPVPTLLNDATTAREPSTQRKQLRHHISKQPHNTSNLTRSSEARLNAVRSSPRHCPLQTNRLPNPHQQHTLGNNAIRIIQMQHS